MKGASTFALQNLYKCLRESPISTGNSPEFISTSTWSSLTLRCVSQDAAAPLIVMLLSLSKISFPLTRLNPPECTFEKHRHDHSHSYLTETTCDTLNWEKLVS